MFQVVVVLGADVDTECEGLRAVAVATSGTGMAVSTPFTFAGWKSLQ